MSLPESSAAPDITTQVPAPDQEKVTGQVSDQQLLQALELRIEVALTVVPLISTMVANRNDRRTVVADVVCRWLALPAADRERYCEIGRSPSGGLERFVWDYVDEVEGESDDLGDSNRPGANLSEEMAECLACQRWSDHLRLVRSQLPTGR